MGEWIILWFTGGFIYLYIYLVPLYLVSPGIWFTFYTNKIYFTVVWGRMPRGSGSGSGSGSAVF